MTECTSSTESAAVVATPGAAPLVSVVIAAYNRADIIGFAVRSALLSEGVSLEVIVVGDACTDDTAAVIGRIGDPRVRFLNLSKNWGEQSVASNEGVRLARGRYVAFLNQDDLFLPWHLRDLVAMHAREGIDVAWSPFVEVSPPTRDADGIMRSKHGLGGVTATYRFDHRCFIVASATSYRREVLEAIGGWHTAAETAVSPSQDLLFRAHRAGFTLAAAVRPSVLVLWSGARANAYSKPSAAEHADWFDAISGGAERLRDLLMTAGVSHTARQQRFDEDTSLAYFLARPVFRLFARWLQRFGVHPETPKMLLRHGGRGGFINHVRARVGLPTRDFSKREGDGR